MNISRNSSLFSTSSSSTYSNDGGGISVGDGSSGRRLSYFNWDGFEPDPNFWNIDDDDDDTTTAATGPKSTVATRTSSAQPKAQQKVTKQSAAPTPKSAPTPKKTATPQAKKVGQSPVTKSPQSLQKKVVKRPTAGASEPAASAMSSVEAARMSASPLASKKPRTSIPSPQTKTKSAIASPKVKTPGKTVSFASALTETYEIQNAIRGARGASPAQKAVDLRTKTVSSPSPAKPALKKTVTPTKSPQVGNKAGVGNGNKTGGSSSSKEGTPVKGVTNAEMIRMIQEQNAKIEKLAKELEKEKAARLALEKRLKFY